VFQREAAWRRWRAAEKAALLAEVEAEGGRVAVVARRRNGPFIVPLSLKPLETLGFDFLATTDTGGFVSHRRDDPLVLGGRRP